MYFAFRKQLSDNDFFTLKQNKEGLKAGLKAAIVLFAAVDTTLTDSIIACLMIGFVLYIGTGFSLEGKRMPTKIKRSGDYA